MNSSCVIDEARWLGYSAMRATMEYLEKSRTMYDMEISRPLPAYECPAALTIREKVAATSLAN